MNRDDAQQILEMAVGDGSQEFGSFFLSRLFGSGGALWPPKD
jgi:hypothetical protein